MFEFAWIHALWLLPLPIMVYLFSPERQNNQQTSLYFPHVQAFSEQHGQRVNKHWLKKIIAILAWCALVVACARPMWYSEPIPIPTEGRDLMLAVDLSGSMKQEDMQIERRVVNRLDMVKSVMDDFIERRVGDRLGLILFADTAYLQTPLTYDRDTVKQLLSESVLGLVGESTAIGDAIGLAVKRFTERELSNRVLILLTDGSNTAGNITIEQALQLAKANEVTIYSIGVGSEEIVQNSFFGPRRINPSSDLDETTLIKLSRETGGEYFRARDANELSQIYELLDVLEPIEGEAQTLRPQRELFHFPMAFAMILMGALVIAPLIVRLKNNLVSREVSLNE